MTRAQTMEPLRGCPQGEFSGRAQCTHERVPRWGIPSPKTSGTLTVQVQVYSQLHNVEKLCHCPRLIKLYRQAKTMPLPLASTALRLHRRGHFWRHSREPCKIAGVRSRHGKVRHSAGLAAAAAQSTTGLGDWFFTESGQKDWVSLQIDAGTLQKDTASHELHCGQAMRGSAPPHF